MPAGRPKRELTSADKMKARRAAGEGCSLVTIAGLLRMDDDTLRRILSEDDKLRFDVREAHAKLVRTELGKLREGKGSTEFFKRVVRDHSYRDLDKLPPPVIEEDQSKDVVVVEPDFG